MQKATGYLSDIQRAVLAAKAATVPHGGGRDRARGLATQAEAASEYRVSLRAVRKATAILKRGIPALIQLLEGDGISLHRAAQISRLSHAGQKDETSAYLADHLQRTA